MTRWWSRGPKALSFLFAVYSSYKWFQYLNPSGSVRTWIPSSLFIIIVVFSTCFNHRPDSRFISGSPEPDIEQGGFPPLGPAWMAQQKLTNCVCRKWILSWNGIPARVVQQACVCSLQSWKKRIISAGEWKYCKCIPLFIDFRDVSWRILCFFVKFDGARHSYHLL